MPDDTAAAVTPRIAAAATGQGFKASAPVAGTLMLTRSFRPAWSKLTGTAIILLGVVLGSLDLGAATWLFVFLGVACIVFVRTSETVALVIVDAAGGVDVSATGEATAELFEFVTHLVPGWAAATVAPDQPEATRPRLSRRATIIGASVAVALVAVAAIAAAAATRGNAKSDDYAAIKSLSQSYNNLYCEIHRDVAFPDGPPRTVYRCGLNERGPCFTVSNGRARRVDSFSAASRLGCTRAARVS